MSKPVLFTYWRSSCAWRVRIALNLKGVEYEPKSVNLLTKAGPNADECFALNPAKKVPVFIHNGKAISESLSIIEYIDEVFPRTPLLPKDPVAKAKARAIALHVATGIHPLQNSRVQQKLNAEEEGKVGTVLTDGLAELEQLVKKSAGKFAVGDEVTMADLCIPSILYNARRWGVDLTPMPTLVRIETDLNKIPAFEAALPDNQPDAPKS